MSIKLRKQGSNLVGTPTNTYVQLFVDSDGLPKVKDSNGVVTDLSQSNALVLNEQAGSPAAEVNKFKIYSKDVAGVTELFFLDNGGNEIQVTSGGVLNAGGGLTQDPVIHHASFAAVSGTSHYVWIDDAVSKTITLPASPLEGDRIEISTLGGGNDNITINGNGNDITWYGFQFASDHTFKGGGFHCLLRWTASGGGLWTNISDDVGTHFGNLGSPQGHGILFSESDGRINTLAVNDASVIGRTGGGNIQNILINSLASDLSSEFWAAPTTPHANDREFTSATLPIGWQLFDMGTNSAPATNVATTPVAPLGGVNVWTNPASGTCRIEAHTTRKKSWLLLQPIKYFDPESTFRVS
jgi:hypothetical protein